MFPRKGFPNKSIKTPRLIPYYNLLARITKKMNKCNS